MRYSFEKLEVWKLSRQQVYDLYKRTARFPKSEQFGLTMQIRRSAVSISSNIAEGTGRTSFKEKVCFVEIAYGSLIELLNQLILAADLGYIEAIELTKCRESIDEISRKLSALRNAYRKK